MTTKLTKIELVQINSKLSAQVADLGPRVGDLEKENAALRAQLAKYSSNAPVHTAKELSPRRLAMNAAREEAMRTGRSVVV